jgi:hypothetical protein
MICLQAIKSIFFAAGHVTYEDLPGVTQFLRRPA